MKLNFFLLWLKKKIKKVPYLGRESLDGSSVSGFIMERIRMSKDFVTGREMQSLLCMVVYCRL